MTRTVDLDAFVEELNADPLEFVFGGKTYTMPPEISLIAIEEARKLNGEEVSMDEVGKIIDMLLNQKGAYKQMQDDGMGFKVANKLLNDMLEEAMRTHGADEEEVVEEEDGDVPPEETSGGKSKSPSKTASRTSRSSKPRSNGSTKSGRKNSPDLAVVDS